MKTYTGMRGSRGCSVFVQDGEPGDTCVPLAMRPDLAIWPGFEWGYVGRAPEQLAVALLADCCGAPAAVEWHGLFLAEIVAKLPREEWTLGAEDIEKWLWLSMELSEVERDEAQPESSELPF
jgi:hypothetical protein